MLWKCPCGGLLSLTAGSHRLTEPHPSEPVPRFPQTILMVPSFRQQRKHPVLAPGALALAERRHRGCCQVTVAVVPITAHPCSGHPQLALGRWGHSLGSVRVCRGLPHWSQLTSCLHSVASNSIPLQQHTTYICTKQKVLGGTGTYRLVLGKKPHNFSIAPIPATDRKKVSVLFGKVLPCSTPVLGRADKHPDCGDVPPVCCSVLQSPRHSR